MTLQGVRHPISCLRGCYANDPPKWGSYGSAPALDQTTSLLSDLWFHESISPTPWATKFVDCLVGGWGRDGHRCGVVKKVCGRGGCFPNATGAQVAFALFWAMLSGTGITLGWSDDCDSVRCLVNLVAADVVSKAFNIFNRSEIDVFH